MEKYKAQTSATARNSNEPTSDLGRLQRYLKTTINSIMYGINLSVKENIRSIDRATQAFENVPKVIRSR